MCWPLHFHPRSVGHFQSTPHRSHRDRLVPIMTNGEAQPLVHIAALEGSMQRKVERKKERNEMVR